MSRNKWTLGIVGAVLFLVIFLIQSSQDIARNEFLSKARNTGRELSKLETLIDSRDQVVVHEIQDIKKLLKIERAARNDAQKKAYTFNFVWGFLGMSLGVCLGGCHRLSGMGGARETERGRPGI